MGWWVMLWRGVLESPAKYKCLPRTEIFFCAIFFFESRSMDCVFCILSLAMKSTNGFAIEGDEKSIPLKVLKNPECCGKKPIARFLVFRDQPS